MSRKKLCIITGSRSEWGLFYPLASEIKKSKVFDLQIIATGAHLSKDFGLTYKEIIKDGFKIDYRAKMLQSNDTTEAIMGSVCLGMDRISRGLKILKPDLVFLLGDRFETFSAAVASFFLKVPIAHIHGGEVTEGSLDDGIRHAITKFSQLHFTSANEYRKRVVQMGETPERVFSVGALGVDNIKRTRLLSRKELQKSIGFELGEKNVMLTFNPPTAERLNNILSELQNLLKVVGELPNTKVIITQSNPDLYSGKITQLLNGYVRKNQRKTIFLTSMGRRRYLSALRLMDVVAGNSSSGVIEVPSFGIPTINIGSRQDGRVKAGTIIDSKGDYSSIKQAFKRAFSDGFRKRCKTVVSPYGNGDTAKKIVSVVRKKVGSLNNAKKYFYNIGIGKNV